MQHSPLGNGKGKVFIMIQYKSIHCNVITRLSLKYFINMPKKEVKPVELKVNQVT